LIRQENSDIVSHPFRKKRGNGWGAGSIAKEK
jgi:hypothetical protein